MPTDPPIYRFADFEFRTRPHQLRRQDRRIDLFPQPARLLELFLRRAGELVTREEIRAELWAEDVHVDHERGINFNVRQIRSALGDDPARPQFLETVPRHGYRLIVAVQQGRAAAPGEDETPAEPAPAPVPTSAQRPSRWLGWAAGVAVLVLVGWLLVAWRGAGTAEARPALDAGLEGSARRFCDHGNLLLRQPTAAANSKALDAFAAASTLAPAAPEPHVGSARALFHLGRYDEAKEHARLALELQDDHPAALLLRAHMAMLVDLAWDQAGLLVERALDSDPQLVDAHVLSSDLHAAYGRSAQSMAAARRAVELDPLSLSAATTLALSAFHDHRLADAVAYAERVLELQPGQMLSHDLMIYVLARQGRDGEAIRVARELIALHGGADDTIATVEDWWRLRLDLLARQQPAPNNRVAAHRAAAHLALGHTDQALDLLGQACDRGWSLSLVYLRLDPRFDAVRLDPRFHEALSCLPEAAS